MEMVASIEINSANFRIKFFTCSHGAPKQIKRAKQLKREASETDNPHETEIYLLKIEDKSRFGTKKEQRVNIFLQ